MAEAPGNSTEPVVPEKRAGRGFWRSIRPHFRKLLIAGIGALVVIVVDKLAGLSWSYVVLPGQVRQLTAQVSKVVAAVDTLAAGTDTLRRGQSIEVAWKCLDYSETDTLRFRASREACFEAFSSSRLERSYWRRLLPSVLPPE